MREAGAPTARSRASAWSIARAGAVCCLRSLSRRGGDRVDQCPLTHTPGQRESHELFGASFTWLMLLRAVRSPASPLWHRRFAAARVQCRRAVWRATNINHVNERRVHGSLAVRVCASAGIGPRDRRLAGIVNEAHRPPRRAQSTTRSPSNVPLAHPPLGLLPPGECESVVSGAYADWSRAQQSRACGCAPAVDDDPAGSGASCADQARWNL